MATYLVQHACSKAHWARRLVREKLAAELNMILRNGTVDYLPLPLPELGSEPLTHHQLPCDDNYKGHDRVGGGGDDEQPPRKVCIVGAGVAGLYIAMILDSLKIPGLTYDILEANFRVGGRAYTHYFSKEPHDYYDIGAMRYPDIPTMSRTFKLFDLLEIPRVPYYLDGENTPSLFNDRFHADGFDPYQVSVTNGGSVPDDVVDNVSKIFEAVFGPYKKKLAANFDEGFDELMKVDNFSTREFLKRGGLYGEHPSYDFFAIQWMETQNTSTNLFDQAFSESVMDSFDFDYPSQDPGSKVKWHCIDGGTTLLSNAMRSRLSTAVQTNKRVEAISIDRSSTADGNMSVKCSDESAARTGYATVFNTTTLGCLGRMDLRGLELHPSQKDAIRTLHYDDSVKVALRFRYPWWIVNCGIRRAGVASTDLPLRTCVYPSYSLADGHDKPAVLLASYTWSQDATRMGSMLGRPPTEEELVELVLRNLARLHQQTITYEEIKDAYTGEYHAYSWSHDPMTAGAFALFGPGQFSNLYPYLSRPGADSKFHIVGEAASAHHSWIVGALDSAYAAVHRFLYRFQMLDAIDRLVAEWGTIDELEAGENGTVHLQVMLGALRKKDQYKV